MESIGCGIASTNSTSGDKRQMFRLQRGICSALKNTGGFRQEVSYLLSE